MTTIDNIFFIYRFYFCTKSNVFHFCFQSPLYVFFCFIRGCVYLNFVSDVLIRHKLVELIELENICCLDFSSFFLLVYTKCNYSYYTENAQLYLWFKNIINKIMIKLIKHKLKRRSCSSTLQIYYGVSISVNYSIMYSVS